MGTLLFTHGGVQVQLGPSSTTPLPPAMGYIVMSPPFCPPPGTVGLPFTLATILIVRLSPVSLQLGNPSGPDVQWVRLIGTS